MPDTASSDQPSQDAPSKDPCNDGRRDEKLTVGKTGMPPHGDFNAEPHTDADERYETRKNWEKAHSIVTLIFNGLLVLTAAVGTYLVVEQLEETRGANKIASDSYKAARNDAEVSRREAVEANQKAAQDAKAAADRMERSVVAFERLALVSEQSVRTASRAMRLDQRAWLSVILIGTFPVPGTKPVVGRELAYQVTVKNSGKTPAVSVSIESAVEPLAVGRLPNFLYSPRGSSVIGPNAESYIRLSARGMLTTANVEDITSGKTKIYAHGRCDYADVFGAKHWMTFCFELDTRDLTSFTPCEAHNNTGTYNR